MKKTLLLLWFCTFCVCCSAQSIKPIPKYGHLCTMMGAIEPGDSLIGESTLLWQKKKVSVYFMDDDGSVRNKVLAIANGWKQYSGITFIQSYNQQTADIRVSFRTDGWWSYIGYNAKNVGTDSVTLSLDRLYLYSPAKFKSVVLHEFGHALGLLHEHQSPFVSIHWKKGEPYAYYNSTYGVDSAWVKGNVLDKFESLTGIYCEPDKKSIMIYAIPPGLADEVIIEPLDISELDRKYIRLMYANKSCK